MREHVLITTFFSLLFLMPSAGIINSICVTLFINIPVIVPIIILLYTFIEIFFIYMYIYIITSKIFKLCKIIPWITTTNGIPPRVT